MHGNTCMSRHGDEVRDLLTTRQVLFSCEGKAERVIITRLLEDDCTVVPERNVVRDMDGRPCTLLRRAKDIQREFLDMTDYPDGLLVARIVDVNPDVLKFNQPYRLRDIVVRDFITRPEIERIVLVKEEALTAFLSRRGSDRQLNASDWCRQKLGLEDVKAEAFLQEYWKDSNELVRCIRAATSSLGGKKNEHLSLVDLLR